MTKPKFTNFHTASGWNALLPPRRPRPALEGARRVKYAIVGAGFTGVAAARRLFELDPGADIMLLDASEAGEGSSGRNSGFTRPMEFPVTITAERIPKIKRAEPFTREGFDYLQRTVQEFEIDCAFTRAGVIRGAATELGEKRGREMQPVLDRLGYAHKLLTQAEIEERTGTPYYRCGLYLEDSYFVQPAALIRGLVDTLPPKITVHERSLVRRIIKGAKWNIALDDASVTADHLVLATNPLIKQFGYLKSRFVTTYTYAAITEAIGAAEVGGIGTMPTWGILPAHRMGTTCRRVGENRLMVRSLASYEAELSTTDVHKRLRTIYEARWPHLAHVPFEFVWGGMTGFTWNGAPWWGKLDDGLYAAGGCNGTGISKGTLLGKRLAELITGRGEHAAFEAAIGRASWIMPEPFRKIGFGVLRRKGVKEAALEA